MHQIRTNLYSTNISSTGENTTQTNGTFVYYLKPNANPSKKRSRINILNIITLARTLNTIRNIASKLKNIPNNDNNFNLAQNFYQKFGFLDKLYPKTKKNHRHRRFISFFKPDNDNNMVYKILGFLLRHHKKVIPVMTVIREISTLIKTGDGEFNNYIKEQNNYIGTSPVLQPVMYSINLNNESKIKTFLKKLFGLKTENLSISTQ